MSNSIGLIESKGLVALVEAIDVISKNSPVEILGVHKLVNGLVTLAVSGNSDYVSAAIESGVGAGRKVGEIYSFSVVDNPTNKLLEIFGELFPADKNFNEEVSTLTEIVKSKPEFKRQESKPSIVPEVTLIHKIKKVKPLPKKDIPKAEKEELSKPEVEDKIESIVTEVDEPKENILKENDSEKQLSTIERLRLEALGRKEKKVKTKKASEKIKTEIKPNTNKNIDEIDLDEISKMNVHKLRHYARAFIDFPIKGREISLANRQKLVDLFNDLKNDKM